MPVKLPSAALFAWEDGNYHDNEIMNFCMIFLLYPEEKKENIFIFANLINSIMWLTVDTANVKIQKSRIETLQEHKGGNFALFLYSIFFNFFFLLLFGVWCLLFIFIFLWGFADHMLLNWYYSWSLSHVDPIIRPNFCLYSSSWICLNDQVIGCNEYDDWLITLYLVSNLVT